jgi:hypothetical protein
VLDSESAFFLGVKIPKDPLEKLPLACQTSVAPLVPVIGGGMWRRKLLVVLAVLAVVVAAGAAARGGVLVTSPTYYRPKHVTYSKSRSERQALATPIERHDAHPLGRSLFG